jgi:hypothetical protein
LGSTIVTQHQFPLHLIFRLKEFHSRERGKFRRDYIFFDPTSRRLYLSHGSEVLVVNADTGQEEGKISGLKVSHGTAIALDSGRGFVTDERYG